MPSSAIAMRAVALDTIADVDVSGLWPGKVVTEVEPVGDFWEAEPVHQDYLERIPNGYSCTGKAMQPDTAGGLRHNTASLKTEELMETGVVGLSAPAPESIRWPTFAR